ncbi:MAG TPA: Ig-like domain-containing protein [Gemmatimonadales bacterium]|nr:Ig-like domain-containing protein [Gemmatimonadales bacterium]
MKRRRWQMLCVLGAAAGCGGGGSSGPNTNPAQIAASAGENQVGAAGQQLGAALEVTVKDGSGSPVANVSVAWAVASGGGSVAPASNTTGADGKATATRTLGPGAGAQTTTATVSGVTPATFHHIAQIQGATQIAANGPLVHTDSVLSSVPYAAVVRNQNSQAVAGVIVTWSVTGGGAALSQLVDTTDAGGITGVTLTLDQTSGPRSVLATVTGLQGSPVTFVQNGVAGNATQMAPNGGNFQAGPVSSPLPIPLSVLVRDAYNNPKQGAAVGWKLQGSVAPPPVTTNAAGTASLTRTLGATPGAYHDTATLAGVPDTIAFSDTAVAVAAVSVSNNFFNPATTTISAATFVKFNWAGGVEHNVTWDGGPTPRPANSVTQSSGSYQARLLQPGTYTYHCTIHGGPGTGMSGSVTVN